MARRKRRHNSQWHLASRALLNRIALVEDAVVPHHCKHSNNKGAHYTHKHTYPESAIDDVERSGACEHSNP